jgi:hypothetical protein
MFIIIVFHDLAKWKLNRRSWPNCNDASGDILGIGSWVASSRSARQKFRCGWKLVEADRSRLREANTVRPRGHVWIETKSYESQIWSSDLSGRLRKCLNQHLRSREIFPENRQKLQVEEFAKSAHSSWRRSNRRLFVATQNPARNRMQFIQSTKYEKARQRYSCISLSCGNQ